VRVHDARFAGSAAGPEGYPEGALPEVAFVGRSNVGKSTLINTLVARKGLAKTSGTPGKTRLINFFRVNDRLHLVDLPGYGFAHVPKGEQRAWRHRIETYLKARDTLRLVVVLVDIRHPIADSDRQMVDWLTHFGRPCLVVATKRDKLSRARANAAAHALARETGRPVLSVSARKREGVATLWAALEEAMGAAGAGDASGAGAG
jgi:GTP-binding protein